MNEREFWEAVLAALAADDTTATNEEDYRAKVVAALTAVVARITALENA